MCTFLFGDFMKNMNFFDLAYEEALIAYNNGEVPVGCVIVKNGEILAKTHNRKDELKSVLGHAELLAIEDASSKLDNWRLLDCDMTKNINNIDNLLNEIFDSKDINDKVNFYSDLDHDRCSLLLKKFFKERR